jgi:hypothetical protein
MDRAVFAGPTQLFSTPARRANVYGLGFCRLFVHACRREKGASAGHNLRESCRVPFACDISAQFQTQA